MVLRPYQEDGFNAIVDHVTNSTESCILEAATGAGKSHIIAAVAREINQISNGKHILCLAPSKELVEQNHEKYLLTGEPASIFSASVGSKCLKYPVVFGTPMTVKNQIHRFKGQFGAVILDEAHGITATIKEIVKSMTKHNPRLRVIGLSATPYRMNTGYIYEIDDNGKTLLPDIETVDPYFKKLVYRIQARELIDQGYLTPPAIGYSDAHYDTSGLVLAPTGNFTAESVEEAFEGQGRLTAAIVSEIVSKSAYRQGVLLFCSTIQHAEEALASLPPHNSALVTGKTPKKEREMLLQKFKQKKIKYLVNVAVLTTGFDSPHVDVIALLRATESAALLQQIVGRGLRLNDGKKDCLILDFAENIERHCPDGDIFNPEITARKKPSSKYIPVHCPDCGYENQFIERPNPDGYRVNRDGYFVDLNNQSLGIPAHYGRRCMGQTLDPNDGEFHQCDYRWASKDCPECGADNDISARYCSHCKAEIIDPNEKLKLDYIQFKKDVSRVQTDKVLHMKMTRGSSKAGNPLMTIEWTTKYRTFRTFHTPHSAKGGINYYWRILFPNWSEVPPQWELDKITPPETITYHKPSGEKFFKLVGFNRPEDKEPDL